MSDAVMAPVYPTPAAEKTQRRARLVELDPKCVDVIVKRWQDYMGKAATLAIIGKTYVERAASDHLASGPHEA